MEFPNCKVINLVGSPNTGKSLTAFLLFARLKLAGAVVEYVPEYAKKLVWAKKFSVLDEQYYVSRKQYESLKDVYGKVKYIVTDGSLVHGLYYNRFNPNNVSKPDVTEHKILEYYDEFNNINIYLKRGNFKYEPEGRTQTEEEARAIDAELEKILALHNIPYHVFTSDESCIPVMVDLILKSE
jgi:hypothetical protein